MGLLLVAGISIAQGLPLAEALSTIVVFACVLQFGYMTSAVLTHAIGPEIVANREARLGESEASLRS
ncbi:hypothetical protein [Bradyrhizobium sp. LTSPM299]|uniref:hypothetical protein n=1 Tax=Bradyrhizobium sp. LTSPM299 TaxID=1619233 RepID=UPI0012E20B4F|nr:hypothetical protein [Bradyrhizobium sp. LTSPM299]